jgi:alpha-tubulin suppressor-like RCC1 family protein
MFPRRVHLVLLVAGIASHVGGCGARSDLDDPDAVAGTGGGGTGGTGGGGTGGTGGGGTGGGGAGGTGGTGGGGAGGTGGTGGMPVDIPVVEQLALGATHTCVLGTNGGVWCWGDNTYGQLGQPVSGASNPVKVTGLPTATALTAGYYHTCAVAQGEAYCWGRNDFGQAAGAGEVVASPTPVGISSALGIAAGDSHTCATTREATFCWGDNSAGQLGDGTFSSTLGGPPAKVLGPPMFGVAAGAFHSCGLTGMGPVCWGANYDGQLGTSPPTGSTSPVSVASGYVYGLSAKGSSTCGLEGLPDPGGVTCWGDNGSGQLGIGSKSENELPSPASDFGSPTEVSVGVTHACAVSATGSVFCWGSNYEGQLGIPGADSAVPQVVPSLVGVQRIGAGTLHTCASTGQPGAVLCWGTNDFGQLGNGTKQSTAVPVLVVWEPG